jgi:hypothetical protein
MRLNALFRLAFATAPPHGLTSPHTVTRRLILQKARHHGQQQAAGDALTACRHTVSGTISRPLTGALFIFPSRYLSAIGHQGVFSLTTWSWQIHTEFHGLRATRDPTQEATRFRLPDSHRLRSAFPCRSTTELLCNSSNPQRRVQGGPTTPTVQRPPAITHDRFRLFRFRSPLLTESLLFSLPAGTEMFHFPAFPPTCLCIQQAATPYERCQVSPFGNPRIKVWLPTPRGISQAPTSFIGS